MTLKSREAWDCNPIRTATESYPHYVNHALPRVWLTDSISMLRLSVILIDRASRSRCSLVLELSLKRYSHSASYFVVLGKFTDLISDLEQLQSSYSRRSIQQPRTH
eukprot:9492137-Pyramimonas_sp.AAC.1